MAQRQHELNPTSHNTHARRAATPRHVDAHNMRGRTDVHTETSTSGINGLEAALSWWEEVGALSEPKHYKAPSVNTLKLFLLFPKNLFISEGIVLSFAEVRVSHRCV